MKSPNVQQDHDADQTLLATRNILENIKFTEDIAIKQSPCACRTTKRSTSARYIDFKFLRERTSTNSANSPVGYK